MNQDDLEYLYNKLANLSEIRGQLSPTGNKITEEQIRIVKRMISQIEEEGYKIPRNREFGIYYIDNPHL
jgi:hypothetical protein